ncbi:MAG: ComF family protein [Chloroflexota bacterium]
MSGLRVAGPFSGPLRHAVHRFKFSGERYLAEPLGEILTRAWVQAPLKGDCLVPVPLHPKQEAARGYNQSTLLAEVAALRLGVPVVSQGLRKVRETPPQVGLSQAERSRNLQGAFTWVGTAPDSPVLVDDVTTTGATLGACAATLRAAGARRVYALVLARAE